MKRSIFLEVVPFVFVMLCTYSLIFEHYWFALAFLVATLFVVVLEFGNQKTK